MSLDWSYSKSSPMNIDEFEMERSWKGDKKLRSVNKYKRRMMLLHEWDVKEEELKARRKETKRIQREREMTRALLPVHRAHELVLSVKQRLRRGSSKSGSKFDLNDSRSCYTEDLTVHSNSRSTRSMPTSFEVHPRAFDETKTPILSDRVVSFVAITGS